MKSSYKLYGTFWDNKPSSDKSIVVINSDKETVDNRINISDVFKSENIEAFNFEIDKQMELFLDYVPSEKSAVVWKYYMRRVMQIAEYYKISHICCKEQDYNKVIEMLQQNEKTKRKTPQRLLAQSDDVFQMIC